nr:ComEA family DNA-binding protein [Streptomyces asoensis]
MALRSRSRSGNATGGPGRGSGSDGRSHRLRPPGGARTALRPGHRSARPPGHRDASAEEIRRRARELFAERPREPGGTGRATGPPGPARRPDGRAGGASGEADGTDRIGGGAGAGGGAGPVAGGGFGRTGGFRRPGGQGERSAGAGGDVHVGVDAGAGAGADVRAGASAGVGGLARAGSVPLAGRVWQERLGPALRERMPVWIQTRCGLERRSVLALTVLLVAAAVLAVQHFWAGRVQPVRAPEVVRAVAPYASGERNSAAPPTTSGGPAGSAGTVGTAVTAGAEIVVDVSGKVRKPGIHHLPAGSRVVDALESAGGVRPGTDTDGLNHARFLVDGEQVVVGVPDPQAGVAGSGAGPRTAGSGGGAGPGAGPQAPVSLNTATVDQLDTLPGVGPVLAQHIVDYRTRHGGFRSADELREVNGIGERRFADLRNLVRP